MASKRTGSATSAGLPPGTIIHVGERTTEKVRITVFDYDATRLKETEVADVQERLCLRDTPTVAWINVDGIHHPDIIQQIGDRFQVHPLTLEDIANTRQRPKTEDFGAYLFFVLKMPYRDGLDGRIKVEQISILLTEHCVISFQERQGDVFDAVRDRLRSDKGRIRKMKADYLAYSLMDAIVDNCFTILETIGERVESLEDVLVQDPKPETLRRIHGLKREMILMRKAMWPLREVISGLTRDKSPLIKEDTDAYLRDLYDHTIQAIDTIETFRDMVSGMLDIYLSSLSNRMNEVMKVLTIIATIFIPLTFIAGIYGMNFDRKKSPLNMPELEWYWGYPAALGVMAVCAIAMLIYFRKKRWL